MVQFLPHAIRYEGTAMFDLIIGRNATYSTLCYRRHRTAAAVLEPRHPHLRCTGHICPHRNLSFLLLHLRVGILFRQRGDVTLSSMDDI